MPSLNLAGLWRYRAEDDPDFSRPELDDSGWEGMRVPQNWFLGGLDHHGVVWFRTEFRRRVQPGSFATLRFDGVDYFADVYLNGTLLGRHAGYFEPFAFDVSKALRSGRNVLAVRVESPYETPGLDGWHLRKKLIKGVLNHHDCRPGGGWEPTGQAHNTGGIWNRVELEEHAAVTIERLRLRADLNARTPLLHVEAALRNRAAKVRRRLEVRCAPLNFNGQAYTLNLPLDVPRGESVQRLKLPVPDVMRWNPWDRGDPNLYTVTACLDKAEAQASFGFRTVTVEEGFNWTVNGERYFPRGSNYLPTQWLSEALFEEAAASKAHPFGGGAGAGLFERDVAQARAANLNLLRVHAHVLPPEFHDACDRAGMLVWQDFSLQWGYSDEPEVHAEALRQLEAMIRLLSNHASIVAWCCHNESPCDAPWMANQAGGLYDPAHNRALDARLEEKARDLDPGRYIHRNSGTGDGHVYPGWYFGHWRDFVGVPGAPFVTEYGSQGLPARENLLRTFASLGADGGYSDLARFKGWLESTRRIGATAQRLIRLGTALYGVTEKHAALKPIQNWLRGWGIKVERSAYRHLPPLEATPPELHAARQAWEQWRFHDFQPAETFDNGIEIGASLDEFIENSQAYQANLIQFATEAYRREKSGGVTGIVQFDFTDPWPAITWSVLDYWRAPKPAYDALRRAMQPLLPSFQVPGRIEAGKANPSVFCVVNDTLSAYPQARCEWRLEDLNGYIASATFPVDIPANGVSARINVTLPSVVPGRSQLLVTLTDPQGRVLAENRYEFRVEKHTAAPASVNPPVEIK